MENRNLIGLQRSANVVRGLAMDMILNAHSGHLGLPLGCAEIGAALFGYLLSLSPKHPRWANRDRFILSAGHGSAWLYSWLYLSGFDVGSLDQFRASGSRLPGHPEFGITPGVECTTGPLGQGIGNAVGFAISQKMQQARLGSDFLNYRVVCLCGDGCLQEGISHEACSLAGHLKLNNLILIYDANDVTLDGPLNRSQSEDVIKRFEGYGFFVQEIDGHDIDQIIDAYERAKQSDRPNLIVAKTIIGKGIDEIAGTNAAHGESGVKYIAAAKEKLNLFEKAFFIDPETLEFFKQRQAHWEENYNFWKSRVADFTKNTDALENHSNSRNEKSVLLQAILKNDFYKSDNAIDGVSIANEFQSLDKISTRAANGEVLNAFASQDPLVITGSADLFSSTKNYIRDGGDFGPKNYGGRNIPFGIREHAMGAILNGIAYDGIFKPSGATFLAFADYLRPAIRIAAMAKLPVAYMFTHDSVAVGQDGPTHQPVESVAALRAIPNLDVIRPGDMKETIGALTSAFARHDGPTALILSRQDLPSLSDTDASKVAKGGYVVKKEQSALQLIIVATGSELNLAVDAAKDFPTVRVVSMPSIEIFERQTEEYKNTVLPEDSFKLIIEAGIAMPWYRYSKNIISIEFFGFSAPGSEVLAHFGFSKENIVDKIRKKLSTLNH